MTTVGRNDPCPCGSGIKYKKCCLNKDASSVADLSDTAGLRASAFKAMSQREWSQAISLFKSVLDDVTDRHTILEAIAGCYEGIEDYLSAAEFYEKTLQECPPDKLFAVTYRLGVARGCAGRTEKALDAFQKCLDFPEGQDNRESLTGIIETMNEIVDGTKDRSYLLVQVQLQKAFTDMDEDRFDEAAGRLERIVGLEPENATIRYNLGIAHAFLKQEDKALEQFQKTIELNPNYAQAWYNMGQICLIKHRDYSRALHCFDRAATARPDYVGAHHQRGIAYELLGDKAKAVECWEKTLELDPNNDQAKDNIRRLQEEVPEDEISGNNR